MSTRSFSAAIDDEVRRQTNGLELIASENFVSEAVLQAMGTVFTNKYAEGYPGKRYYGGCEFADVVEQLAIDRAKEIFGSEHANVQPHSGAQANMAVLLTAFEHGDQILGMNLSHGGHLTHGHPLNFSGINYKVADYGVNKETEQIDYDELQRIAEESKPKLLICGASAYPRTIDFERIGEIARGVGARVMADIAHIAGLVAVGLHPSPVPHCEFVTTTTHKTLRGPRGGLILCREEFAKDVDRSVFPGVQGGPLVHIIAAKAVSFGEALQSDFKAYQQQIVAKCQGSCRNSFVLGIASGLRWYRQSPSARRCLYGREGNHGQSRRKGARRGSHHRQQEHDPIRYEQAVCRFRNSSRDTGIDYARNEGTRDEEDRRDDRGYNSRA